MASQWTNLFSYVTGAGRYRDLLITVMAADELAESKTEHSYCLAWDNGTWRNFIEGSTNWTTVDAAVCPHPIAQGLFLGLRGEVLCGGSGDVHQEIIREGEPDSPENRGMMRGLGVIDGKAYAVGIQRQAYRRDGANAWVCIDHTTRPSDNDGNVYSFEHIAGFSENEIYAAGRRGEIWLYENAVWKQQDSPTNMILTKLCCAGDNNVYVCGRFGTLLRGRENRWELIKHGGPQDNFWGIAWYGDNLYVSTMRGVLRLDGDHLVDVDFEEDIPSSCFALSAADGVLWSIGPKDIMAFDGQLWTRID